MYDLYKLQLTFQVFRQDLLEIVLPKPLTWRLSSAEINHPIRPYLQLHEFEALLFVNPR